MPAAQIPFTAGQASGIEELAGASPAVINLMHDPSTAVKTRPGLSPHSEFPTHFPDSSPVIGMWVWNDKIVYCTQARNLFALIAPGLIVDLGDGTLPTQLDGTLRPVAVVTKTRIVIIGGGLPQKWEGVGLSARLGGSPPTGGGLALIAQRLVISDLVSGLIFWSEPGELAGHEVWLGDPASAEAETRDDPLLALGSTAGELFAFGSQTTQIMTPDPDAIFLPGSTAEVGTLAAASVVKWDTQYVFLDDRRRLVSTDGRSFNELSTPEIAKTIWQFTTVTDCWSFRALIDGLDMIGFVFPTEGRACVYNATVKKWAEWRSVDDRGQWLPWVGYSHVYWPSRGVHLIGLNDGTVAKLDTAAFTENGQMLRCLMRTGFENRELGVRKVCERVQLTMRRGSAASATTAPVCTLRYRDNLGSFSQPLTFSLGVDGDVEAIVQKWTLGVYNTRQWELSMTDPNEFVLAGAEETFTPLEA